MKLEELFNSLIEKGWKPFGGQYYDRFIIESDGDMCFRWQYPGTDGTHSYDYNFDYFKIRELVSKESGLWQFVCGNKKLHNFPRIRIKNPTLCDEGIKDVDKDCNDNFYEYWLIECALCDEDKLEKFLIENIQIGNED